MDVKAIMSNPAVVCGLDATLHTAAQLMWENDCGAVAVVDESGAAVGIVTDRDICMAAYTQGAALPTLPVSTAMAKQVFSCRVTDSIETAERLMAEKQVRRIPVVDGNNRPVGLLSLNDVARHAASSRRNGAEHELTLTLAAICQPRRSQVGQGGQGQLRPV